MGVKGTIPWNKGKTGIYSQESLDKMSHWRKGRILSIVDGCKICTVCKVKKLVSEFYKDRSVLNGYGCRCKECIRKYKLTNSYAHDYQKRKWRTDPVFRAYSKERAQKCVREQAEENKKKARKLFGESCGICTKRLSWNGDTAIHHTDGSNLHQAQALKHPEYWDECIALCRHCHTTVHMVAKLTKWQVENLLKLRDKLWQSKRQV